MFGRQRHWRGPVARRSMQRTWTMAEMGRRLARAGRQHFDLWLALTGVAVALIVPLLIEIGTNEQEIAAMAVGVILIQGFVAWQVNRRARRERERLLDQMRHMLQDRVNNKLQVVAGAISGADAETIAEAMAALREASAILNQLSESALEDWEAKYPATPSLALSPPPPASRSSASPTEPAPV
jgi:Flp pilus assembly protein TadB